MAKKFPSELSSRGTVKTTDKLMIHNIDTGETCYCTVAELIAALSLGGISLGGNIVFDSTSRSIINNGVGTFTLSNPADAGKILLSTGSTSGYSTKIQIAGRGEGTGIQFYVRDVIAVQIPDTGINEYADNAAAVAAGLTAGAFYRTGDALKIVHT